MVSNLKNKDSAIAGEQTEETKPDETQNNITWDEIAECGVNEDLLVESIIREALEKIVTNLQKLCKIIAERERASDDYVISAGWPHDYPASEGFLERFNEKIIEKRK